MKYILVWLAALGLTLMACQEPKSSPPPPQAKPLQESHSKSIQSLISFFDTFAWQSSSGTYLSEIGNQGEVLSAKVYNVALSRLVYWLSYASIIDPEYLKKAEKASQYQLDHLIASDSLGAYFLSFYDDKTQEADTASMLDVWQQAYGLCGLTELYRHNRDERLLPKIHTYHEGFINQFHDKTRGGFYGNIDRATGPISGSKSLQSLMYPITAYMENLWRADTRHRSKYEPHLKENVALAAQNAWNGELGWVNVKLEDDWNPCPHESAEKPCFHVVPGHNFQLASLLLRTKDWSFLTDAERESYRKLGIEILNTTLAKPIFAGKTLSQGFFSEVNPMNDSIVDNRKTWWQHCEALLSLSLADGRYSREIAELEQFYFAHFPDKENGGEYFFLDRNNVPQTDVPKGSIGKSLYHTTEMIKFLSASAPQKE